MHDQLLQEVCDASRTTMAALHVVSGGGTALTLAAGTGLPDLWREWIEEIPMRAGIGAGLFAEAAVFKRTVIAASRDDRLFDGFRVVAQAAGIGSGWTVPILSEGGYVSGTLAILYEGARTPTAAEIAAVRRHVQRWHRTKRGGARPRPAAV